MSHIPFSISMHSLSDSTRVSYSSGIYIIVIAKNKWDLIFDFTTKDSGKNYEFLDPSEFKLISKSLGDFGSEPVSVFPYPERYGGTLSNDANQHEQEKHSDDNMMAFSITTSQQDASKVVEAAAAEEEV